LRFNLTFSKIKIILNGGLEMNLNQKIIKPKMGLLELAKSLGSISSACKAMGYSRDSYYRFKEGAVKLSKIESTGAIFLDFRQQEVFE
jgi:molybdenum-dependent DNA-binding transcriptional regulator ModE